MDLFTHTLSHKEKLWEWLKTQYYVRSSSVQQWGSDNFVNEPGRYARKLAEEGKIRRLTEEEKDNIFPQRTREGVWKIIR